MESQVKKTDKFKWYSEVNGQLVQLLTRGRGISKAHRQKMCLAAAFRVDCKLESLEKGRPISKELM